MATGVAYEREQVDLLLPRLTGARPRIQAIFGPRHSGKTTIARQALSRLEMPALYRAADNPHPGQPGSSAAGPAARLPGRQDRHWLVQTWQEARRLTVGSRGAVLVLDEIQKVANWQEAVRKLWDEDRQTGCPLDVIVVGVAPASEQSGPTESLGGRVDTVPVSHWSFAEMADGFGLTLDEYIFFGGWPGAAPLAGEPAEWRRHVLSSLLEASLERDLLESTGIEKPALLKRLVQLGCAASGQILSFEKIQRELGDSGNIATLADYLRLLEHAGILAGLPNVTRDRAPAAASRRKLLILNTALMAAAAGCTFEEARADRTFWRRMVETSVGAHLMNSKGDRATVSHWRHREGAEVDFVLSRGRRKIAVSISSGRNAGAAAHRRPDWALREFERRFRPHRSLLVAPTFSARDTIPLCEFLSRPASSWFEGGE